MARLAPVAPGPQRLHLSLVWEDQSYETQSLYGSGCDGDRRGKRLGAGAG